MLENQWGALQNQSLQSSLQQSLLQGTAPAMPKLAAVSQDLEKYLNDIANEVRLLRQFLFNDDNAKDLPGQLTPAGSLDTALRRNSQAAAVILGELRTISGKLGVN